jgi:squalene-hopene/tetraprenyl-beta-curcumene cyclase
LQFSKAAIEWIRKHHDLKSYHLFAKALDAVGEDVFIDEHGRSHNWRAELIAELAKRQQADGA